MTLNDQDLSDRNALHKSVFNPFLVGDMKKESLD